MDERRSIIQWLAALSAIEKTAVVGSLILAGFLLVDPLVYGAVQTLDPAFGAVFRWITDLGKSGWILLPAAGAVILLTVLRTSDLGSRPKAAHGFLAQGFAFVFLAVAASGLAASLTKNILGRARPKLFDAHGSVHFEPFSFTADFASFPSGHATTICALAAVIAILWPRTRVLVFVAAGWIAASRFLIGAHFFSDAVAGALLGSLFPYWLRDRLAARRWLFARLPGGRIELRGRRLARWIGREAKAKLVQREAPSRGDEDLAFPGHL